MKLFTRWSFRGVLIALVLVLLAIPLAASAAELVTAELTAPNNDVTVIQGGSTSFTLSLSATGNISSLITSGAPSTAKVNTSFNLTSGVLSSSSPSGALNFFAGNTGCGGANCNVTWTGAPTPYTVNATVSADASTPVGNYTITLSDAANTTDVNNPAVSGGKLADTTATMIIIRVVAPPPPADSTPPVITPNVSGTLGNNGWYTSDVTVSWSVVDNESTISNSTGCGSTTIDTDTAGTTLTCSATSVGGTNSQSVTVKRDATAPTISGTSSPVANGAGWNNSDVTVSFTCNDNLSGLVSCGPNQTLSNEGAGQSASGTAVDDAGNSASTTVSGINIDKTGPTLAPSVSPNPVVLNGSATANPGASDLLSGIASASCGTVDTSSVGSKSVSCTATDLAGNTATANAAYSVVYNWNGFFRPVDNPSTLNTVKAGSAIPVKFSLGGNQGLNIFASGSPTSQKIGCDTSASQDSIEETVTAGSSSLSYDPTSDQYNYVWKTDKGWAGTCRQLVVKLIDGTTHTANFNFTK